MDMKAAQNNDKNTILTGNIIPDFTTNGEIVVSATLDTKQEVLCVHYTADLAFLAAGFTDGFVRIFNPEKGQCVYSLIDDEILRNPVPVTCIKHRHVQKNKPVSNTLLCSYVNGCIKCWDYPAGECIYTIHESRQILGLAYCPKMPKFVSVGDDGKVILYDEEKKCQERVYKSSESSEAADGHTARVYAACFHPKNPYEFMTGGWDDTVMYWDIRKPASSRHYSGVHMCGEGLDISPSGKELYCGQWLTKDLLAAGGSDPNLIRIVDFTKGMTIAMVQGFPKGVYSIDTGALKARISKAKKVNPKYSSAPVEVPKVAFCAGKRIYELYLK